MKNSIVFILVLILFSVFLTGLRTVEFTASWKANTERDISHYNLYRYCKGDYQKINDDPIMHPTTSYKFPITLSGDSIEKLCFAVTAVDTSRNESCYSDVVCIEK